MSETMTEKDLAARWHMTTRTLLNWRSTGVGPPFIRVGERSIIYRRADILAYEDANVGGTPIPKAGWHETIQRVADALEDTKLRDELRSLIA